MAFMEAELLNILNYERRRLWGSFPLLCSFCVFDVCRDVFVSFNIRRHRYSASLTVARDKNNLVGFLVCESVYKKKQSLGISVGMWKVWSGPDKDDRLISE